MTPEIKEKFETLIKMMNPPDYNKVYKISDDFSVDRIANIATVHYWIDNWNKYSIESKLLTMKYANQIYEQIINDSDSKTKV